MNGLTLLAPAGLFALAAVALPVLIHLFSRSRGRRVLVGNIALYRQARRQRVSELRLVQWLLLLLRTALLAVAALLLAGLARDGLDTLPGDTAYVTPEWLTWKRSGGAGTGPPLTGFRQVFLLTGGFPVLEDGEDEDGVPAGNGSVEPTADPWSLLAERLASVRHEGEVHVYALATGGQFPGRAPALGSNLRWHLAEATEAGTGPAPALLSVRILHAPERRDDATLVATALDTLAHHRRVPLGVSTIATEDTVTTGAVEARRAESDDQTPPGAAAAGPTSPVRTAVVWLAAEPPPAALEADVVLEDRAPGPGEPVAVRVDGASELLFRARPAPPEEGGVRWRAVNGAPVLVERRSGGQRRLVLLDRLGAGAGGPRDGLADQSGFPDALLGLLLGDEAWAQGLSEAAADPRAATARIAAERDGPTRPLAPWLALVMVLLLGTERWLSERPRRAADPTASDP